MRHSVIIAAAIVCVSLAASGCDRMLIPASADPDPVFPPIAWSGAFTDGEAMATAVRSAATTVVPQYGDAELASPFPDGLVDDIAAHDIALIGETHYMLEHQKLLVSLMKVLHARGWRAIAQELDYSIGLIVDDYVTGKRDAMPDWCFIINRVLIEGLRKFNMTLPEADRVHLVYFDMEHSGQFRNVLEDHAAFRNDSHFSGLFSLRGNITADAYRGVLTGLRQSLIVDETTCRAAWGDLWYGRVVRMIDVEFNSLSRRYGQPDDMLREDVIFSNVSAYIAEYGKILVNMGSAHAEKKSYMTVGNNEGKWLGVRLNNLYGSRVWSLDVTPLRGSLPHYYGDVTHAFNYRESCEPCDFLRIVSEVFPGCMVYMKNSVEPFLTQKIGVNHIVYVPGETYDAELLYPEVSPIAWD